MIKLCGNSIVAPLIKIFNCAISSEVFPNKWKKGNITPVHKKSSKHIISNYRPISLLPIFGKIFEKIIFNNLYSYFDLKNIFAKEQSGFRSGDSCVSQLIAITHDIYKSLSAVSSHETRGVFLDMSKAFDKVWHTGLLFKLKQYGVEGDLYNILDNYLHDRKQRVVLNGQVSDWEDVTAGVPQGSVLGPLLFLIYINDLPDNLFSKAKLFADDTSIFSTVFDSSKSEDDLNNDLSTISKWAFQWKMVFNPDPNKQATEVVFSHKRNSDPQPDIFFNNNRVMNVPFHKHLGLILDSKLNFSYHLQDKFSKANKGIGLIKKLFHMYHVKLFLPFTKLMLDPILTMLMSYMTSLKTKPFVTKSNQSSTMQL